MITEEDCKNQIIQDALDATSEKDLTDIWNELTSDFNLADVPVVENIVCQTSSSGKCLTGEQKTNEELITLQNNVSQEDISEKEKGNGSDKKDEASFSLQFEGISSDEECITKTEKEIELESDNESVMVSFLIFEKLSFFQRK